MNLPMVDCRSLIEFCKAFEQQKNSQAVSDQRNNHNHSRNKKHSKSLNPLSHSFCDHSPFAAIDILVFLLVLGALGVLTVPYFKVLFDEACEVFPEAFVLIGEVIYTAPFAYAIGLVVMFVSVILAWEVIHHKSRKCGNPYCKGLRKAVEFDIQLESEACVKYMPPLPAYGVRPLELGEDHKELEAELKRMAPLNGRTVLIFRAPCGCPTGRMEVWGPKNIRRIKNSEKAELRHSLDTLETNSESCTLAASSPAEPRLCLPRVSWAFSSTDWQLFSITIFLEGAPSVALNALLTVG